MKITEINPIKTIDLTRELNRVEAGSGKVLDILKDVYARKISLLVIDDEIVGINYDAQTNDIVEDNIQAAIFGKKYIGQDVENYIMTALDIAKRGLKIVDTYEDDDVCIITTNEEEIRIEKRPLYDEYEDEDYYDDEYEDDEENEDEEDDALTPLREFMKECEAEYSYYPKNEMIQLDELVMPDEPLGKINIVERVKDWLRYTYNRYLSGKDPDPEVTIVGDIVKVKNISWGRKR